MSSHGRESFKRLLRGSLAYGLLPLVGLITAPLLARVLGPTGRGQLAAVLQPLTVIEAVIVAGVPTAVTYFIGRGSRFRDIRKQVVIVTCCTCLVAFSVIVVYSKHIALVSDVSHSFILGVWSTVLITLWIAIRRAVIQGRGYLGVIDVERMVVALLRLGSVVLLFSLGVTAVEPYIAVTLLPGLLAVAVLLLAKTPKKDANILFEGARQPVNEKSFYAFALLAGSGHIANILNIRIDQALLPLVLHPSQLGLFSVAVTIAEIPLILSTVAARNLLTEASRGADTSALIRSGAIGTIFIALVSALMWLICPWAVTFIFGTEFTQAADIARVLLLGTVFSSVASFAGAILSGTGYPGMSGIAPFAGIATFTLGFISLGDELVAHNASMLVLVSKIVSCTFGAFTLYLAMRRVQEVVK